MRLEGKVAAITGAASGIGRASAILFAQEGAKIVVADYSDDGVETVNMITANGGEADFVKTDVSKSDDVKRIVKSALDRYGKLDIVFNNAGIEGDIAPTAESSEENFDRVVGINLKGVFLGMKYALPVMLEQGGGVIINMSSIAGLVGFIGLPAYNASKGGIIQLTKTAALEYATKNIRANAICPGVIRTSMVDRITGGDETQIKQFTDSEPVKRLGNPLEVAELALFLASDESSFVTGAIITVDGGYTAQ